MPVADILETCNKSIIHYQSGPSIMRADALLKVMGAGYILIQRTNFSAAWLLKQDGTKAGYSVHRPAVEKLVKAHLIEQIENFGIFKYKISRNGLKELQNEEKRQNKPLIPKKEKPIIQTQEPKAQAIKNLNIKSSTIQTGKREWVMTLVITSYETLQEINKKLGNQMASDTKTSVPKVGGNCTRSCFYCKEEFTRQAAGKNGWREVCQASECRKKYSGDLRTKNQMIKAGISIN